MVHGWCGPDQNGGLSAQRLEQRIPCWRDGGGDGSREFGRNEVLWAKEKKKNNIKDTGLLQVPVSATLRKKVHLLKWDKASSHSEAEICTGSRCFECATCLTTTKSEAPTKKIKKRKLEFRGEENHSFL